MPRYRIEDEWCDSGYVEAETAQDAAKTWMALYGEQEVLELDAHELRADFGEPNVITQLTVRKTPLGLVVEDRPLLMRGVTVSISQCP